MAEVNYLEVVVEGGLVLEQTRLQLALGHTAAHPVVCIGRIGSAGTVLVGASVPHRPSCNSIGFFYERPYCFVEIANHLASY